MLGAAGPAGAVGGGGGTTGEEAALDRLGFARRGRTPARRAQGHGRRAAIGSAIGGAVGAGGSAGARCSDTPGMGAAAARSSAASDLDPAQLPAEPDGFHQRGDGHDREGQQQQPEHDKE